MSSMRAKAAALAAAFFIAVVPGSPAHATADDPIPLPPIPITHIVKVRPIIVSNDDGTNTANSLGEPGSEQYNFLTAYIKAVWAQAGIRVDFLPTVAWNSTVANIGDGTATVFDAPVPLLRGGDVNEIIDLAITQGVADPNSNEWIDMYFVQAIPGRYLAGCCDGGGLGNLPNNSFVAHFGSAFYANEAGRLTVGGVTAHELGHNLGLPHPEYMTPYSDSSPAPWAVGTSYECPGYDHNLMLSAECTNPKGASLNAAQIARALTSPILHVVDGKLRVSIRNASVLEGNSGTTAMVFTVTLNRPSTQRVRVRVETERDTARSSDFKSLDTKVTFAPGETVKLVTVQVYGDTNVEPDERFYVRLEDPKNASTDKAFRKATGVIVNDD